MKNAFNLDAINSIIILCYRAKTIREFKTFLCNDFRELISHEMGAIGIIETDTLRLRRIINLDFPKEYLDQIADKTGILACPAAKAWSCCRTPQFFDITNVRKQASCIYTDAFCHFDVQNIASHGVVDLGSNVGSYFVFGRLDDLNREKVGKILELVVPHFHMAFAGILSRERDYAEALDVCNVQRSDATEELCREWLVPLSAREREVLTWLYYGKTNGEIATILNVSTFTVKNHVQKILLKLSANNRSHAVWRAMEAGLVGALESRRAGNGNYEPAPAANAMTSQPSALVQEEKE